MKHLIKLLPDSIANQIAAGEVVQRPASVVKELMENAIDAGATRVDLLIKDAGKSLIQVIDNGAGMSSQDARMSFERHATSKIAKAEDLFNIRTMGFRGEALASISAVAQVELKTRLHTEELGTKVSIEGSKLTAHEPVMTAKGSSLAVKNLFFNVPARRNFLKSNPVETRHIINEFVRIALAHPDLAFQMDNTGTEVYHLEPSSLEDRIVHLFGKQFKEKLLEVAEETPYLKISGYVGMPETATKSRGEQYFFVNERFIKSPYLNHAVCQPFSGLIHDDKFPFYCLFLEIAPGHIDINIHPTKTEIKFDDERTVYTLLQSVIKKTLGAAHLAPEMEEDDDNTIGSIIRKTTVYNENSPTIGHLSKGILQRPGKEDIKGWEKLFEMPLQSDKPEKSALENGQNGLFESGSVENESPLVQTGLVVIDQQFAHQRVLFEELKNSANRPPLPSQQMLFPKTMSFAPADFALLNEVEDQLKHLGFDLREFGPNTMILNGTPAEVAHSKIEHLFDEIIADLRALGHSGIKEKLFTRLAKTIAQNTAIPPGKKLSQPEMRKLVNSLFSCEQPGLNPGGKPVYFQLDSTQLDQHFGR